MENWTLGGINAVLVFVVTFTGTLLGVYALMRKITVAILKPTNVKLEAISIDLNTKMDTMQETLDRELKKVDKNATMNYLVRCMEDLDKGANLEGVARLRFIEQYEHYIAIGGNSYIKEEYERLKKSGKI